MLQAHLDEENCIMLINVYAELSVFKCPDFIRSVKLTGSQSEVM